MFNSPESKREARRRALTARQALPESMRLAAEHAIAAKVITILAQHTARRIAGYAPIRGEIDCRALLLTLKDKGYETALPVVIGDHAVPLIFRRCPLKADALVSSRFGILEPDESCPEVTPDVLLVPLVGFDAFCHRIGYGAGFYDRTISHYKKEGWPLLTIGLAFSCQKFDKIDAEGHDQPLDYVVTETDLYHSKA